MKNFELTKKMLSMGGVFYPTGYAFIMFPDSEDAKKIAHELETASDGVMLLRLLVRDRNATAIRSTRERVLRLDVVLGQPGL